LLPQEELLKIELELKIESAKEYQERGYYYEALLLYKSVIKSNPENPLFYRKLASLYASAGKYEKVIDHIEEALAIFPEDSDRADFYFDLAYYSIETENNEKAKEYYRQAISFKTENNSYQHKILGDAFCNTGDYIFAIKAYTLSLEQYKYIYQEDNRYTLENIKGCADLYKRRRDTYFKAGDYSEALKDYIKYEEMVEKTSPLEEIIPINGDEGGIDLNMLNEMVNKEATNYIFNLQSIIGEGDLKCYFIEGNCDHSDDDCCYHNEKTITSDYWRSKREKLKAEQAPSQIQKINLHLPRQFMPKDLCLFIEKAIKAGDTVSMVASNYVIKHFDYGAFLEILFLGLDEKIRSQINIGVLPINFNVPGFVKEFPMEKEKDDERSVECNFSFKEVIKKLEKTKRLDSGKIVYVCFDDPYDLEASEAITFLTEQVDEEEDFHYFNFSLLSSNNMAKVFFDIDKLYQIASFEKGEPELSFDLVSNNAENKGEAHPDNYALEFFDSAPSGELEKKAPPSPGGSS